METPTRWTAEPFRGSPAVRLGVLTKDRLRGPDFHRLHRDVYVGCAVDVDVRVRVRALAVWSRERGVVAGPLAALAYGADCSPTRGRSTSSPPASCAGSADETDAERGAEGP